MARHPMNMCCPENRHGLTAFEKHRDDVKEVAYRLQFSDEHYFANIFRQKKGLPPGKYRITGDIGT